MTIRTFFMYLTHGLFPNYKTFPQSYIGACKSGWFGHLWEQKQEVRNFSHYQDVGFYIDGTE